MHLLGRRWKEIKLASEKYVLALSAMHLSRSRWEELELASEVHVLTLLAVHLPESRWKETCPDSSRLLELKPVSSCRGRPTPEGAGGSKGSGTHQRSACTQVDRSASAIQPCAVTALIWASPTNYLATPCLVRHAFARKPLERDETCSAEYLFESFAMPLSGNLKEELPCQRSACVRIACSASAKKPLGRVLKLLAMHLPGNL
jgi:hypothetical protein